MIGDYMLDPPDPNPHGLPDRVDCEDCYGEGEHSNGPNCGCACDYCGGCYDFEDCITCDGTGKIDNV